MKHILIMLRVLVIVGAVEILVTFFLQLLDLPQGIWMALLDAGLLLALSAPFLYVWVVRVMAQRLSENYFQDLVQELDVVVWEADATSLEFTFVNQRAGRLLDYPVEQWVTEPNFWLNHTHLEDRERILALRRTATAEDKGYEASYRMVAADGRLVWLQEEVRVSRDVASRARQLRGVMTDITEHKQVKEAMRQTAAIVESSDDAIIGWTLDGIITSWNSGAEKIYGHTADEVKGRPYSLLIPPDRSDELPNLLEKIRQGKGVQHYRTAHVTKDGNQVPISFTSSPIKDWTGNITGISTIARDIIERKRAEKALKEANENLKTWVNELERRTRESNLLNEMGDLLVSSLTSEEAYKVIAQFAQRLFPGESGAACVISTSRNLVEAVAVWGESPPGERVFAPDDCWALRRGRTHWVEDPSSALLCRHVGPAVAASHLCVPMMAQSEALGLLYLQSSPHGSSQPQEMWERQKESKQRLAVAVAEHIALALANLKLREILRTQSIRDPLTGLFNRRYMEESLERELRRAIRKQRPLGAIMIDLDHFKRFNDTFGHEAGDTMLQAFGRFLQNHIREEDIACRYGGEEFLLIFPETSLEILQQRAQDLREEATHLIVLHRGQPLGAVTLSLGVASFPEHGSSGDALLRAADAALYRAKREGRDRVVTGQAVV